MAMARTRCRQHGPGLELRRIGPHRLSDVLNLLLPDELVLKRQLVAHCRVHRVGDANATGFRQALKACGDVDPVAINLVAIDDDFAQIDANAELDLAIVGKIFIAVFKILLDRCRTEEGVGHGGEICQHGIAGEVQDRAVMFFNRGGDGVEIGA